jgi:hypothetical protein
MPAPRATDRRTAQINIEREYGADPQRAIEGLIGLLTRAGKRSAAGDQPAATRTTEVRGADARSSRP